jgi:hypothetical protein
VTQNIITASEIQQGDKIKVTITDKSYEDRPTSRVYEGVAHSSATGVWRTEGDWNLYAHEPRAVIELLDRPKPKLTVPTLPNAVIKYTFAESEPRFAVRDAVGKWVCYDAEGLHRNIRHSDEDFQALLLEDSPEFEVVFAGVAK